MPGKNSRNMSIALNEELKGIVNRYAEKRGIHISALFQDLIKKHLIADEKNLTVILKIPVELKDQPEKLKDWLDLRTASIVKSVTGA